MPTLDPILLFIKPLNNLGVPYMVKSATACIAYGQPRLTHDVDIVLELDQQHIPALESAFPLAKGNRDPLPVKPGNCVGTRQFA